MNDFSHWDFADDFHAREAAALIRGLDPEAPSTFIHETDPVLGRLRSAYFGALYRVQALYEAAADLDTADDRARWIAELAPHLLHSKAMLEKDNRLFADWIERKWCAEFYEQRFSRSELERWLRATGLIDNSKYKFDRRGSDTEASPNCTAIEKEEASSSVSAHHETVLERIQREAKSTFFATGRKRDPKKEEVTEWIKLKLREAGEDASENVASAMFTIIKPADHNPKRQRP